MRSLPVLLALSGTLLLFHLSSRAHGQSSSVLEASSTMHGIGHYKETYLFVRLSSDGKVEWETTEWKKPNELHSVKISAERVAAITQSLESVDPKIIEAKMGPFEIYTDTSVELQISVTTANWNRQFLVINPWPGKMTRKPLPKDLKIIICEISRLRSQVAHEEAEAMCAQ